MKEREWNTLFDDLLETKEKSFDSLLQVARGLRNAMAYRRYVTPHGLEYYTTESIELLKIFSDDKGAFEVSMASYYIHAARARIKERFMDSYGQHVNWESIEEGTIKLKKIHED